MVPLFSHPVELTVPVKEFENNMRQDGWALIENIAVPEKTRIGVKRLAFGKFENVVSGEQLLEQGRESLPLGQLHAEYLVAIQDKLPPLNVSYQTIAFTGTVWKHPGSGMMPASRCVPCLIWLDKKWQFYFRGIIKGFHDREWLLAHAM